MREVWLYIDESGSPSPDASCPGGGVFHVGVLGVEEQVDPGLIERAWTELLADGDTKGNSLDERTIARGYFHASEDSKNAHSHLCTAIRESSVAGAFNVEQWRFAKPGANRFSEPELHHLLTAMAGSYLHQADYDTVHLCVAQRARTFPKSIAAGWATWWLGQTLQVAIGFPHIPHRFPRIEIEVVDDDVPGIQICDFLLWVVQREFLGGGPIGPRSWYTRLGIIHHEGHSEAVDHPSANDTFDVRRRTDRPFIPATGLRPRVTSELSPDQAREAFSEIDRGLREAHRLALTEDCRVSHLAPYLRRATAILDDATALDDLREAASVFLLVCDTLPLYDPANQVESTRAVELRRCAAAIAKDDEPAVSHRAWATQRIERALAIIGQQ